MPADIRAALLSDIPAIFRVRTSVRVNHLSIEQLSQMGITAEAVAEMIAASPSAWVAVVDDEVVGFSMIDIDDASLFAAFVLPAFEGRGLGKQLSLPPRQSFSGTTARSGWKPAGIPVRPVFTGLSAGVTSRISAMSISA